MVKKGREGCVQEQDYLSCRFKVIITNSPLTPQFSGVSIQNSARLKCLTGAISLSAGKVDDAGQHDLFAVIQVRIQTHFHRYPAAIGRKRL